MVSASVTLRYESVEILHCLGLTENRAFSDIFKSYKLKISDEKSLIKFLKFDIKNLEWYSNLK